jgi:hypothetical protein
MDELEPQKKVTLNSRVKVVLLDSTGDVEEMEFTLVASRQADLKSGLLDENAPLGRALMGRSIGDHIPYALGDLCEVRILDVQSGDTVVSPAAAQKRRADVKKAAAQSEITNQMIFATASGSKWGDYEVNVDKFMEEDEKPDETES